MNLQDLIAQYRRENNLSQRQFAEKCGLSNGYISMIEKGENPKTKKPIVPQLPALAKIAYGMNISLEDLLSTIEEMPVKVKDLTQYSSALSSNIVLTPHESKVITAYRDNPPVQPVVDKILDVEPEQETASPKEDTVIRLAAIGNPSEEEKQRIIQKIDSFTDTDR